MNSFFLKKATNVSMDVNDNDGNVICNGGKIFKMRHQMACAILGMCKILSRFWNRKETLHYTQIHRTHIHLFSGKRATLLVMHTSMVGHFWKKISIFYFKLKIFKCFNMLAKLTIRNSKCRNEALRMERKWKNLKWWKQMQAFAEFT